MKINTFNFTAKTFGLALAATLALLIGVGSFNSNSVASAQVGATAELPSATEAKQELAQIPVASIPRIKNASVREAAQQAVAALQAVANNKEKSREAALVNAANQGLNKLKAATTSQAAGSVIDCLGNAAGNAGSCQEACSKRGKVFCGCLLKLVAAVIKCF